MLVTPVNKVISINNKEGAKMKKTTQTARRKALKRVTDLVDSGANLTNARIIVAGELGIASTTLAKWEHAMTKTTPTVKIVKTTQNISLTFEDIRTDSRKVFRSLVNKDGEYNVQEANAISKFVSNEVRMAKTAIEVHKLNTKVSTKHVLQLR